MAPFATAAGAEISRAQNERLTPGAKFSIFPMRWVKFGPAREETPEMLGIDWAVSAAGLAVGAVVGLTGMGGGALMTPVLVLLFGVSPTAAVASDLAASLFMKPVGAAVHLKRGTINGTLVRLLCIGSIPGAFAGATVIHYVGSSPSVQGALKVLLGVALLVAASATLFKALLSSRRQVPPGASNIPIAVKPISTIAVGAIGGFIVGTTSVGSGSLIVVMLMLLYPRLTGSRLVGTDLAQAIPLVGAAALAHYVLGGVQLGLTASLLVGSIPGVFLGAHFSARAPDRVIRPVLVIALAASGLKLLGISNGWLGAAAATMIAGRAAVALYQRGDETERVADAVAPDVAATVTDTAR